VRKTGCPMKKMLLCIVVFSIAHIHKGYSQCGNPFPVVIKSNGGSCPGSVLSVTASRAIAKITWYKDSVPIRTDAASTGAFSPNGISLWNAPKAGANGNILQAPLTDIATTDNGDVYVADGQFLIEKIPAGAAAMTVAGAFAVTGSGPDQFFAPTGVFVDRDGNIYVADNENNRIQKWAPGAGQGVTVAGGNGKGSAPNQLAFPGFIYVDCDGTMYISDAGNNRVQKWAPGATSGTTVAGGNGFGNASNQLKDPSGVWLDGKHNVYVADMVNARVQMWAPGAITGITVAGGNGFGKGPGQFANYITAVGIFVQYDGTIIIPNDDNNNAQIELWAPGAGVGTIIAGGNGAGKAANQFDKATSALIGANGNLYVCDGNNFRIQEFKRTITPPPTTYTTTGAGGYYAVVTDINGYFSITDTIVIHSPSVSGAVQIDASTTNTSVCTPITFTATPATGVFPLSWQWFVSGVPVGGDSAVYTNDLFANGDQVSCLITTASGCTTATAVDTSNVITLAIDPQGHASITIDDTYSDSCAGSPVDFTSKVLHGAANPSYLWYVNGIATTDTGAAFTIAQPKNGDIVYCLITSDASCGLAKSNSIPLTLYPLPAIPTGLTFSIPYGQTLPLDPDITGDIASYAWTPGTGLSDSTIRNPIASPPATTAYTLKVVSTHGCVGSGTIVVDVYTPLSIPNAFTPNGDGRNDVLYILGGPQGSRIKEFAVFNRYGQRVFQVHDAVPGDPQFGWNGTYNGKPVPAGTYVYLAMLELTGGQQQSYKGTVMVIR
jgi:gliding motility-associated-like protein